VVVHNPAVSDALAVTDVSKERVDVNGGARATEHLGSGVQTLNDPLHEEDVLMGRNGQGEGVG
jgi:hypothetical protein